jgi:hypothetical protein
MRPHSLSVAKDEPAHSPPSRALVLVRGYYWLAPVFLGLWLGFDIDVRFPFLDVLPGARAALYATQLGCAGLLAWRPSLTALVGTVESTLSIGLLIVTTWMAYWGMYLDAPGTVANPFTSANVASLVASATVLTISYLGRISPR